MTSTVKIDTIFTIKLFLTFGITIIISLIPTGEIFTAQMRMAIALTYCMLAWAAFELTDLFVPAILWPIAMILTGTAGASVVYAPFLSTTVMGAIGSLCFCNILDRTGILKRVAFWLTCRSGGTYTSAVFAIFFAGLVISFITFASGCLVIAAMCFGFCKALNIQKTKEAAVVMMTGMLAASTTRMFLYYPITMGCMLGSIQSVDPNFSFGFKELMIYNWPVIIFCLAFVFLMVKIANKNSTSSAVNGGKEYFVSEYKKLGPLSRDEKYSIFAIAFVLLWILSNPLTGLDSMSGFIIGAVILCLPKIGVASTKEIQTIPWGTVLFFASCMAIGSVCNAVGITTLVADVVAPLISKYGTVSTLFIILLLGFVLNFAMTPVAMLAGFSGTLYTLALNVGIDPLAFIFTFNHSTDMVLLPYEYLTFLLFFSFGMMTTGQFLKYHLAKNILYFIFFGIIIIPYWYLVGLL